MAYTEIDHQKFVSKVGDQKFKHRVVMATLPSEAGASQGRVVHA